MVRLEIWVWIIANLISFVVSVRDLKITARVWSWTRRNIRQGEMYVVSKRNVRASLFRSFLATVFVLAGISVFISGTGTFRVLLLVAGSISLTLDVILESRYRSTMFQAAQRRAEAETPTQRRQSRKENGNGW